MAGLVPAIRVCRKDVEARQLRKFDCVQEMTA
jgi:hypothetical protein